MNDVDLTRHAVIEASAGTGKTHTLEQLVLRLLCERGLQLRQILLVTYTEKATGELKGRLRTTLERAAREQVGAREQPAHRATFQAALAQFDQANIFTIHGFCQHVLQEHAFDHGQDFRLQLVDDAPLLRACLRELQRTRWHADYGDGLRGILELAGYQGDQGAKWEQLVLRAAQEVRPACGQRLRPEPLADWPECVRGLEDRIRLARQQLMSLANPKPDAPPRAHPWAVAYSAAVTHRNRLDNILVPVIEWLSDPAADTCGASSWLHVLERCQSENIFCRQGFRALFAKVAATKIAKLTGAAVGLEPAVAILDEIHQAFDWGSLRHPLAVRTIVQLQQAVAEHKRQRGLISFEDMLARVAEGLDPARNPGAARLADALRQRFHAAIVDEFQDTDPLQWRILRRIFVEGGDARLFVVGDAKQAIYAFRGADLPTYLTAVRELTGQAGAVCYPLSVNWRSSPEMLGALNHLFEKGQWLPADGGIDYAPVEPPPENARSSRLLRDESDRAALTVVELRDRETLTEARRDFARFCAAEIARLLARPALIMSHQGAERALQGSDVCVLLHKRSEAGALLAALRRAGIPHTFYKQTGLWQSDEAKHLGYVLRALSRPGDREAFKKALLTWFFRIGPAALASAAGLPAGHRASALWSEWLALAEEGRWGALFQSLLYDTGILHPAVADAADSERRLANLRHLFAQLEQAAYGQNLDLFALVDWFGQRRLQPGEDADYQPIETQRPKVRIMTIHAAKGLEFPVVFVAGGFTSGRVEGPCQYHDEDGSLVVDLCPTDAAKQRTAQERLAEERRKLYVALTRAMFKLYVPWARGTRSPGPLVEILAPALERSGVVERGAPYAQIIRPDAVRESPSRPSPKVRGEMKPISSPEALFPRLDAALAKRRIYVRSFSSLHRQSVRASAEQAQFAARPPRADDDDERSALEAPDTLRGPIFGDVVHGILERIDFAAVGQAATSVALLQAGSATRDLVDEILQPNLGKLRPRDAGPDFEETSRRLVAELVWRALHVPLSAAGGPLWQVPPEDRLHELEFLFPERVPESAEDEPPPEIRREEGFLTGFMDLVFRGGGRYFLVDWKTNWLPAYTGPDVSRCMEACDYHRQYELYLQALERWLRHALGGKFIFERDIGGVYYLFLRGLSPRDESTGVFFHQPAAADSPAAMYASHVMA